MGYVAANTYMTPDAYLHADPAAPVWLDDMTPAEVEFAELDRRLRREVARFLTNPYLVQPSRPNKRWVCRQFRVGERTIRKLLEAWERDGFARRGPRVGIVFDPDAIRSLSTNRDVCRL